MTIVTLSCYFIISLFCPNFHLFFTLSCYYDIVKFFAPKISGLCSRLGIMLRSTGLGNSYFQVGSRRARRIPSFPLRNTTSMERYFLLGNS